MIIAFLLMASVQVGHEVPDEGVLRSIVSVTYIGCDNPGLCKIVIRGNGQTDCLRHSSCFATYEERRDAEVKCFDFIDHAPFCFYLRRMVSKDQKWPGK